MEIRHLKLIKAVAEYKSLTKAANKLFLTQSALSHQVKEIEEEYKTKFFFRISKQMFLTPAGERLLKTANSIIEEIERNNIDLKRIISEDSGLIRVAAENYSSYYWLSSALKSFYIKRPKIEFRIVAEATRKPLAFLQEGKLEIAVVNQMIENPNFLFHPLFEDEIVAVFSKDHPWANFDFITPKDFINENCIIYSENVGEDQTFKQIFGNTEFSPSEITKVDLTEVIVEMVKAKLGVTVLAKWVILPYLNKSELMTLPINVTGIKRTWYAVTLNVPDSPDSIKEFISSVADFTKKQFVPK